ncbi:3-hydroxybutyryl-CoA dehydratase, partial [human gut metagenome]
VALEDLMNEAKKMASNIIANAPVAVKLCKDAINRGMQVGIDFSSNWLNFIYCEFSNHLLY